MNETMFLNTLPPHWTMSRNELSDGINVAYTAEQAWRIYNSKSGVICINITNFRTWRSILVQRNEDAFPIMLKWFEITKNTQNHSRILVNGNRVKIDNKTRIHDINIENNETIEVYPEYDAVNKIVIKHRDPRFALYLASLHNITDIAEDIYKFERFLTFFD